MCPRSVCEGTNACGGARAPRQRWNPHARAMGCRTFFFAALAVLLRVFGRASPRRQGKEVELRNCRCVGRGANKPAEADAAGVLRAARGAEFLPAGSGARPPHLFRQPPWPNGQGVGLLIRRLRVRVPQGVLLLAQEFFDARKARGPREGTRCAQPCQVWSGGACVVGAPALFGGDAVRRGSCGGSPPRQPTGVQLQQTTALGMMRIACQMRPERVARKTNDVGALQASD